MNDGPIDLNRCKLFENKKKEIIKKEDRVGNCPLFAFRRVSIVTSRFDATMEDYRRGFL